MNVVVTKTLDEQPLTTSEGDAHRSSSKLLCPDKLNAVTSHYRVVSKAHDNVLCFGGHESVPLGRQPVLCFSPDVRPHSRAQQRTQL